MDSENLKPIKENDILNGIDFFHNVVSNNTETLCEAEIREYVNLQEFQKDIDKNTFKDILIEMYKTYCAKNYDYGSSVSDTYKKFGLISFLVRMSDKMNRLITLNSRDSKVKDEKIDDTLMDLANYCVLALLELRKERERQNDK